ncbi:MAG TPA: hypothetical protein IAC99_04615, partial [Candidatus Choladocola avistercoris]|nr:hypothetical protein [Candidatus Choladocola avistercoris]
FTIPAGTNPTQSVGATFTNNTTNGMDMSIRLQVVDNRVYNTGVWGANEELHNGKIYVKILDKTHSGADVTGKFSWNGIPLYTADDGYALLETNTQHSLIWKENPNYGNVYYNEIWGTINGIRHTMSDTCECGQTHAANDVDEYGNILLVTSTPGLDRYLTMPDETGIAILDSVVTYNATRGTISLNVLVGSGIDQLTGNATLTVVSTSGGSGVVTVSVPNAQWNGSICTFTIPASERGSISGNCSASFTFTNDNGTVTYSMSQGFVAN